MKRNRSLSCILSCFFLLFCLTVMPDSGLVDSGVVKAYAANAPAAQKKPEAKKPPVAQPKAKPPATPRQSPAPAASAKKKQTPATQANRQASPKASPKVSADASRNASMNDALKSSLDVFAKDCISRMNKQRRPGINAKEVKRQADGSYMARYMAVDPDSLSTSYNPTENNKTIPYIGRMNYHEVEYVSTGKDQKQALAGPFNESNRTPITELIKYKAGKWTY